MIFLYDIIICLTIIFLLPYIIFQVIFLGRKTEWIQRFGIVKLKDVSSKNIWIHCASVGEVNIAEIFIREFKKHLPQYDITVSVITSAGFSTLLNKNLPVKNTFFLPFDLPFFISGIIKKLKPNAIFLIETEIWPNLILQSKKNFIKVALINGRISEKSFKKYLIFKKYFKKIFSCISLFLMREETDAKRIKELGADKNSVYITGNIKFDRFIDINEESFKTKNISREKFEFSKEDKIFTAGSVREKEEEYIINAFEIARKELKYTGINLKLIIAPRHLNRVNLIEKLLKKKHINYMRRTSQKKIDNFDCLILDTIGELLEVYFISDITFVGGSLVNKGGQNIIEPAILSRPVLFGPSIENFAQPAEILIKNDGADIVKNESELAEKIIYYIKNPELAKVKGEKARNSVMKMSGVTEKNIYILKNFLLKPRIEDVKKILIIQPSRIGDVIFSLPFLSNLRKLYPDSYISWIVDERCADILENNPYLDEKIIFPFKELKKELFKFRLLKFYRELLKLKKTLKQKNFDMTIDLHGLAKSAVIVLMAGAKYKFASSSSYGMKELSWLFSKEISYGNNNSLHCIERHLAVMEYLGGETNREFNINIPEEDKEFIKKMLSEMNLQNRKIALLFPGGGWHSRRWESHNFSLLADRIINELGLTVIFIGGKTGGSSEEGLIDNILSKMKNKAYDFSNKISLLQLAALISISEIFIGNEAGPMHLACALDKKVVAIIGPTDPSRTGPFGKNYRVVRKKIRCAPCRERNCKKIVCMKEISVDDVLNAVKEILN